MCDTYKPEENTKQDGILSKTNEEEDYDIYEHILDNIYTMTEMVSSEDEETQLKALRWFTHTFRGINYPLAPDLIVRIFNLINSNNRFISKEASIVINWAVSFNSAMQDILLANGLLNYIITNFPYKGTTSMSFDLTSQSPTARSTLIKGGYIEKLRLIEESNDLYVFSHQLSSLVKLPFEQMDPDLLSEIFDTFQLLWAHLHQHDNEYNKIITIATQNLLKSNINFLYAFIHMEFFTPFLHVPSKLDIKDEPYYSTLCKMLRFIINQKEEFAIKLIDHGVVQLIDVIITNENNLFPDASIDAMNFMNDLIFYCPHIIEDVYDREIPHCIADMFDDEFSDGKCIIDALSFIITMMALASPMIFSKMVSIGCYTLIVENIMAIEDLYWKWTIRVLHRGFVTGKDEENQETRQFLGQNDEFIDWLENVKKEGSLDVSNAALTLLVKIFPDYVNEV
ncbi:hypothetical protein M9Y10_014783 [Tritrichomonas musculus]|uniref:Uncharacterized protein n=1 Tax=Tritrichomonas musculus TaxID=1915356 RepID=A0ABR2L0G5_9EUKA